MPGKQPRVRIDGLLRYRNSEVIARFCDEWDVTRAEAQQIFADLLRYFWLVQQHTELGPVPIVDQMWHTFLVFTERYAEFSRKYFGSMLHHVPTTSGEKRSAARLAATAPDKARARAARRLERDITAVFDAFGETVALRWYVVYTDRYSTAFFATKRKPLTPNAAVFPDALLERAHALDKAARG